LDKIPIPLTSEVFYGQPLYYQQKMTFQLLYGIKVHVKYTEHLQCAFKYQPSKISKKYPAQMHNCLGKEVFRAEYIIFMKPKCGPAEKGR